MAFGKGAYDGSGGFDGGGSGNNSGGGNDGLTGEDGRRAAVGNPNAGVSVPGQSGHSRNQNQLKDKYGVKSRYGGNVTSRYGGAVVSGGYANAVDRGKERFSKQVAISKNRERSFNAQGVRAGSTVRGVAVESLLEPDWSVVMDDAPFDIYAEKMEEAEEETFSEMVGGFFGVQFDVSIDPTTLERTATYREMDFMQSQAVGLGLSFISPVLGSIYSFAGSINSGNTATAGLNAASTISAFAAPTSFATIGLSLATAANDISDLFGFGTVDDLTGELEGTIPDYEEGVRGIDLVTNHELGEIDLVTNRENPNIQASVPRTQPAHDPDPISLAVGVALGDGYRPDLTLGPARVISAIGGRITTTG